MSRLVGWSCGVALAVAAVLPLAAAAPRQAERERVARLVEQLGDDEPDVRDGAEDELKALGEPALGALLKASRHTDAEVRRRARRLLPAVSESKAKRLLADLGSKQKDVREAAFRDLTALLKWDAEKFQRDAAKKVLTAARKGHRDAAVREQVTELLAVISDSRIAKLIEQLGDDSWDGRAAAELELLKIGEPALEQLKEADKHADLEIRNRARRLIRTLESAR
jgi:hypothetical protein